MVLSSQERTEIEEGAVVSVAGDLRADAATPTDEDCAIDPGASITYGTKSSVCEDFLP